MSIQELSSISTNTPAVAFPMHRFSVEEYHRLGEKGFFPPGTRVELLDGWIVDMTPIGIPHRFAVEKTDDILSRILPSGWWPTTQQPIRLPSSEPQPDICVLRGTVDDYRYRHAGPADIGLIIEVADSSLLVDRNQKVPIYAAAGIPACWIINLVDREAECYSLPGTTPEKHPATYRRREIVDARGALVLILDDREVAKIQVADLLP
jgi:Uma2 family endonuclease